MIHRHVISLSTSQATQFIDVTREVEKVLQDSGIRDGVITVYTRHTTTAIFINEGERGLLQDYKRLLNLVPEGADYEHDRIDRNAHAHLRAVLLGGDVSIPVLNGRMDLGTWQRIFFAELDGPRQRRVVVQIVGEK